MDFKPTPTDDLGDRLLLLQRVPGHLSGLFYSKIQKASTVNVSLLMFGCAVCFGDPSALTSKALITSVTFLGGVAVVVLAMIGWTAYTWAKRAKDLPQ